MRHYKKERGSTLLFVAVGILPLLFFAFAISLDFARNNSTTKNVQEHLSRAASVAARRFPVAGDVEAAAKQYLALTNTPVFGERGEKAIVSVKNGTLFLGLKMANRQVFGGLLTAYTNGDREEPSIAEWVRARVTPFDSLIVVDASSYLSPLVTSTEPWGTPSEWPEAQFFNPSSGFIELFIPSTGQKPLPRIATQQCFNPAFNPVKAVALQLYSYFSNFEMDQVGVGVAPGFDTNLDLLRRVRQRDALGAAIEGLPAEAALVSYKADAKADYFCQAAAELETHEPKYLLPAAIPNLSRWKAPPGAPASMVVPPAYRPNPDYAPYTSIPQAVWSLTTRDRNVDFSMVLKESVRELLLAPPYAPREGMDAQVVKNLFIVAGDVPWLNGKPWTTADKGADTALRNALRAVRRYVIEDLKDLDVHLRITLIILNPADASFPYPRRANSGLFLNAMFREELMPDSATAARLFGQVVGLSLAEQATQLIPSLLGGERSVVISGGA